MANHNLNSAKKAKKDEFYTQISDIERELRHYTQHFVGKVVLCNCDDPRVSHFTRYFKAKFHTLGLKMLITTCYKSQNMDLFSQHDSEKAVSMVFDGETEVIKELLGDGDFRSSECIEFLKEADIVVTNPPFSLFREYVAQLVEYDKKFLIIGHQNNVSYKEFFPLIKENKVWLGYGFKGGAAHFFSQYEDVATAGDHKQGMIRVSGVVWYTNLEIDKRHEEIPLFRQYSPDVYPSYDNYDAIEVRKTADIPADYYGVMGVPLTFLDKYSPDQFEIIGIDRYVENNPHYGHRFKIKGTEIYARILIRRKH